MGEPAGTASAGHREELRWVLVPDGAQRSRSTGTPGYERDLLREGGTRDLLGPTESRPADLDELVRSRDRPLARTSFRQEASNAAVDALFKALSPYVEKAVEYGVDAAVDGVVRLAKWAKRKTAERRAAVAEDARAGGELEEVVDAETLAGDGEVGMDLDEAASAMSGAEYRARFLAALAAERFAAEQKRRLASVLVADEALSPELKSALRSALEGSASSLNEESLAMVVEFLDGSQAGGGEYLLLADEGTSRGELDPPSPR